MKYNELDKELKSLTKSVLKEKRENVREEKMSSSTGYKNAMKDPNSYPKNLDPWDAGITDRGWTGMTSDIRALTYKEKFGNNPSEVYGDGDLKDIGTKTDASWKAAKNSFQKMDWEQPEPNESDFISKDVQKIASKEMARLDHNKSSVKNAYKKHELPDNQGYSHLEKINTKDDNTKGDPLMWSYYRQFFKTNNKTKN